LCIYFGFYPLALFAFYAIIKNTKSPPLNLYKFMIDVDNQGGIMKYETVQFFFRKHWTNFLKPFIFGTTLGLLALFSFLIIGIIIVVFRISLLYSLFAFLAIVVSIFIINTFFLQLINYFFHVVIVTNHRIIIAHKTVFLKNDNDAIDLTKVQDFAVVAHGVLRNYLNYGALIITLSTSTPPIIIHYVPNPHYYQEQMNRVKRIYILERQERRGQNIQVAQPKTFEYLRDIDKLEYGS